MWTWLTFKGIELVLDWLWPRILNLVKGWIVDLQESRRFDKQKDKINKAAEKVDKMIDEAKKATATREARREAAKENARPISSSDD